MILRRRGREGHIFKECSPRSASSATCCTYALVSLVTMYCYGNSLVRVSHDQSSFHRLLIGMRQLGISPRWRDGIGAVTRLP